jgi:hypothetical protein
MTIKRLKKIVFVHRKASIPNVKGYKERACLSVIWAVGDICPCQGMENFLASDSRVKKMER